MELGAAHAFDREALAQLIIEASSAFESDRPKARRCIEQAVELVRGNRIEGFTPLAASVTRGGLSGWQVRHVKAYIEENLGDKILIVDLAACARVSVGHFFRTFRASFGISPQAYIMRQRILRAERLIRSSNEPLARIALECGLCDQAHLSRSFRRIVGVSPNVWRREIGVKPQHAVIPT
jgi:transcriptional regulator GlxA family with amidase domain